MATEYHRSNRLVPLWLVLPFTLIAGLGSLALSRLGFWVQLALAPAFLMIGYGLLIGFLNRSWILIDTEGVRSGVGPVPVGPAPAPVLRAAIAKVYVRHAVMVTKTRTISYLAAGVERTDGCWNDLSDIDLGEAEVRQEAASIAAALCWPHPVEELRGTPKMDWRAARGLFYWGGALVGVFAWGVFVLAVLRRWA